MLSQLLAPSELISIAVNRLCLALLPLKYVGRSKGQGVHRQKSEKIRPACYPHRTIKPPLVAGCPEFVLHQLYQSMKKGLISSVAAFSTHWRGALWKTSRPSPPSAMCVLSEAGLLNCCGSASRCLDADPGTGLMPYM